MSIDPRATFTTLTGSVLLHRRRHSRDNAWRCGAPVLVASRPARFRSPPPCRVPRPRAAIQASDRSRRRSTTSKSHSGEPPLRSTADVDDAVVVEFTRTGTRGRRRRRGRVVSSGQSTPCPAASFRFLHRGAVVAVAHKHREAGRRAASRHPPVNELNPG